MYEAIYNDNSPVTTGTTCVVSLYNSIHIKLLTVTYIIIDNVLHPLTTHIIYR